MSIKKSVHCSPWHTNEHQEVSFFLVQVHGHFPGRCRGAGHGGKFRESCSPANITREELTEAGRVLEPDEYDSNPGMEADWSNYFDWTGDVPTVLERIVTHMNVNTLVLS